MTLVSFGQKPFLHSTEEKKETSPWKECRSVCPRVLTQSRVYVSEEKPVNLKSHLHPRLPPRHRVSEPVPPVAVCVVQRPHRFPTSETKRGRRVHALSCRSIFSSEYISHVNSLSTHPPHHSMGSFSSPPRSPP